MENQLRYQVRSREIIDLVSAMRTERLTLTAYFQRNLVWRETHKHDFIDPILHGYPFPQIFLARGPINIDTMQASTCVVDGQQRLNAIREFVSGKFSVNGCFFKDLPVKEKEDFFKYEVPIIDFDLDAGDPRLKEVFKRLNRTFYSLSTIERIATEFSASQFLLVARVLSGGIARMPSQLELEVTEELDADPDAENSELMNPNDFLRDPGIDSKTWNWLLNHAGGAYSKIITSEQVFSNYEAQRKVPLMFVLNVMCSIEAGYFNRNSRVKEYLERYNDAFPDAEVMIARLNRVGEYISEMQLPPDSMWWNKANFFTLSVELENAIRNIGSPQEIARHLSAFQRLAPSDFSQAAKEAVNNKTERALRASYFRKAVGLE